MLDFEKELGNFLPSKEILNSFSFEDEEDASDHLKQDGDAGSQPETSEHSETRDKNKDEDKDKGENKDKDNDTGW